MAKKVVAVVKLQVPAGKANPSPPVGPALGQHGINIMEFCKTFNAQTQHQEGLIIPAVITIYADRSFSFITKTPCGHPLETGSRHRQSLEGAEPREGGKSDPVSSEGDCQNEDARSECE